ncbi:maltase A1-like [Planococcus citri]|uniref:maltase A1-like n=1 Tax=Planococcus citri TaxID=170843 RepID=UPI0031F812BC
MNSVFSLILLLGATTSVLSVNIDNDWWRHANIYEPYTPSFKDSDGDGIGDINGLISKLDYLVEIGVDTIHLPPFHPSGGIDGGYDITDFYDIDPKYGKIGDFKRLTEEMKERNLYLLMDLVINHTSWDHEWFKRSIRKETVNGIDYTNWFVWADSKGDDKDGKPIPPNNWFYLLDYDKAGSAWTWNDDRKQFYYHVFMNEQPDLNLRNEDVKNEIKNIMRFWLDRGVSGFRVDAPMVFMEDPDLKNNPPVDPKTPPILIYDAVPETANHPDTFPFIKELNEWIREYDRETHRENYTPMIGEIWGSVENQMKYFEDPKDGHPMIDMPFNYIITRLTKYLNAEKFIELLHSWIDELPKGKPSNWALGNHDSRGRIAYWFNEEYNYILLAVVSMLPGASTVYYGEELGMSINKSFTGKDPTNREWVRTPMQWDDTKNAGFTDADRPWAPAHPNYWRINVGAQETDENSSLKYFTNLMTIRKTDLGKYGDLEFHTLSEWVFAFSRTHQKSETSYVVLLNLGSYYETVKLKEIIVKNDEETLNVLFSSPNSLYKAGTTIRSPGYDLELRPHSVIIFEHKRSWALKAKTEGASSVPPSHHIM